MKGWSGSRSRGRPAPATPMATTRTWVNLAARECRGLGQRPLSPRNRGRLRPSVSHRQPVEDIRQFLGGGDGLSRFAMQLQAFRPQARQIPASRFPIHF